MTSEAPRRIPSKGIQRFVGQQLERFLARTHELRPVAELAKLATRLGGFDLK